MRKKMVGERLGDVEFLYESYDGEREWVSKEWLDKENEKGDEYVWASVVGMRVWVDGWEYMLRRRDVE